MITKYHRQEGLSRAYVQAVAAKAGFGCNPRTIDYGMDFALHEIGAERGRLRETGIVLDVQVRSTTIASVDGEFITYDLDRHTYEMLRNPAAKNLRLLVLLVLPSHEDAWLQVTEQELLLRHAAYWYIVKGEPATKNRRSVRLTIPRLQLFNPEALQQLAMRIQQGEHK